MKKWICPKCKSVIFGENNPILSKIARFNPEEICFCEDCGHKCAYNALFVIDTETGSVENDSLGISRCLLQTAHFKPRGISSLSPTVDDFDKESYQDYPVYSDFSSRNDFFDGFLESLKLGKSGDWDWIKQDQDRGILRYRHNFFASMFGMIFVILFCSFMFAISGRVPDNIAAQIFIYGMFFLPILVFLFCFLKYTIHEQVYIYVTPKTIGIETGMFRRGKPTIFARDPLLTRIVPYISLSHKLGYTISDTGVSDKSYHFVLTIFGSEEDVGEVFKALLKL